MTKGMPNNYRNRSFGTLVNKGKTDDKEKALFSWNAVAKCQPHKCPGRNECQYEKVGKCLVQTKFLKSVERVIFRNYQDILTEDQFFRVGMHLLPLYKILSRLHIEELGVKRVIYKDKSGKKVVHPVYKEIRETIKGIEAAWRNLGLKPVMPAGKKKRKRNSTELTIME